MDAETWLNANKAIEYGFADGILFKDSIPVSGVMPQDSYTFSRCAVTNSLVTKINQKRPPEKPGKPVTDLDKRLELIKTLGGI